MKYIVLVGDGMGDLPVDELGGQTVLQAAHTPNMDRLAASGLLGLTKTIPEGMEPGSDVANMSLMGYDPARYHTGRSPIEAASMGVDLGPEEIAFRCNLVTLDYGPPALMIDYSAGHIDSETAAGLVGALQRALGRDGLTFHPGVSYRHLLVWRGGPLDAATVPPHDRTGQRVDDALDGPGPAQAVAELIRASWPVLRDHPINAERLAKGLRPANSIWLWGQGTKPALPTVGQRFGLSGRTISAVDLVKGLGVLAGLPPVDVPGATGWLDTNYAGKVAAALAALAEGDMAFVHVEAPDEAGHGGDYRKKLQAIEDFDAKVVGPIVKGAADLGRYRVLLMPDHYTPLCTKTHGRQAVPFVIWDSARAAAGGAGFNEPAAAATGLVVERAHELLPMLVEVK
ncbi:cofactor-independent phosphoglycerate mutase [Desulfarculus baarsii]